MDLEGQASQRGYAMAALLVMLSILAIGMLALLPAWRHQAQREKEAELAFRGEQYARAIYLFRTKNGNQPPPNVDVLVQGRYIRKKYKDPVTGEDFVPIFGGQQPQQPAPQGRGTQQFPGGPGGRGVGPQPAGGGPGRSTTFGSVGPGRGSQPGDAQPGGGGPGRAGTGAPTPTTVGSGLSGGQGGTGLVTVQSKSKEASIRIYNNASHYNEWQFLYNARGRGGPGVGSPGAGPGRGSPTPGRGGPVGPGGGGPGRGGPGRGVGPGRGGRSG